mmetsp:Transcript_6661/g.15549  ORF Transcript_6661/g.15549 Transcript_6661/m.15549 type:complete len:323 (+) Transcript_6661:116-1084(+)
MGGGDAADFEEKRRRDEASQGAFQQNMQSQALKDSWHAFKDTFSALSSHWLLALIALIVAGICNSSIAPFQKLILPIRDPALSYPVGVEQVPEILVLLLSAFVPMTVIVLFSHFNDKTDTGVSLLALVQSCSYNMVATVLLKKIAGRPRPCFYAMCEWEWKTPPGTGDSGTGTGSCTGTRKRVWEARQSFPSGHSSLAFSGLFFLSLFLLEKLSQHVRRAQPFPSFLRSLQYKALQIACLLPAALACWIAETRIQDYWHNYDDILAGAVLGTAFAIWFFQQREGYQSLVRESLRVPPNARHSDEMVPMRDSDPAPGTGDEAA